MTETANTLWLDQMFEPGELAGFAEGVSGQLQKDIQPKFKIALPHLLAPEIANKLSAGLHIDILAFLAEGWYAALELDECRKQSLAAPTSSVIAKLGRHIVSRELKPNIVVTYGARQAFDVDAAVVLAGVFEGIELAFEKGRLVSLGSGQCEFTAQLKVAGQAIGQPKSLKSWRLPGRYALNGPAMRGDV